MGNIHRVRENDFLRKVIFVCFLPSCKVFVGASHIVDTINGIDTTRGILTGEIDTSTGLKRTFRMTTGLILGEMSNQIGGMVGEASWRYGTQHFGPSIEIELLPN